MVLMRLCEKWLVFGLLGLLKEKLVWVEVSGMVLILVCSVLVCKLLRMVVIFVLKLCVVVILFSVVRWLVLNRKVLVVSLCLSSFWCRVKLVSGGVFSVVMCVKV